MKHRSARTRLLLLLCGVLLAAGAARGQAGSEDGARITFTKEFPNSQPPYFSILVREDGKTTYRVEPDGETPLEFRLSDGVVEEIFALAGKLHLFRGVPLESNHRVANMGKKTLEYQKGGERSQVSFNYTEIPAAVALVALFERISQTQQYRLQLENLIRYDRLGLVRGLLRLEVDLDQGRLLEPALLLPLLEQVRKDPSLVQVAQGRAAQIIGKIQSAK